MFTQQLFAGLAGWSSWVQHVLTHFWICSQVNHLTQCIRGKHQLVSLLLNSPSSSVFQQIRTSGSTIRNHTVAVCRENFSLAHFLKGSLLKKNTYFTTTSALIHIMFSLSCAHDRTNFSQSLTEISWDDCKVSRCWSFIVEECYFY